MASLTEEEIAYMLAHKDDSRVVDIYVCSIITSVASVLVLVLRFWSRRLHGGRVVLDLSDWFILAAWVSIGMRRLRARFHSRMRLYARASG